MKVLLIQPPVEDFYDTEIRLQPIGLGYLKAMTARLLPSVKTTVLDFHQGHGRYTVPLPRELQYLREFYAHPDRSPFRVFHEYFHFGASYEAIADCVRLEKPDIVGISMLFSAYFREALRTAELVKQVCDAAVVVGGTHVSAAPLETLSEKAVDYVIVGEGERSFTQLLAVLASDPRPRPADLEGIPGLGYKQGDLFRLNPPGENFPIEELPYPDLGDLPAGRYRYRGRPLTFLLTSRGCPHGCSFCSIHTTFGRRHRRRSVEDVLGEIRLRVQEGYRFIDFEDDNLTLFMPRMKELCRRLATEFPGGELELGAMNGISYLSLDDELLDLMRLAGFTHLNISLVSSDEAVLRSTKRPHTAAKYRQIIDRAHALGFKVISYQILGLPGEALDSMIQTLCYATERPVLLGPSLFYRAPGSPLAMESGCPSGPSDWVRARLSALGPEDGVVSREELFTLFVTSRIINFLKGIQLREGEVLGLGDLLSDPGRFYNSRREQTGVSILRQLLKDGVLLADTAAGFQPVRKFEGALFSRVWRGIREIACLEGGRIELDGLSGGRLMRSRATTSADSPGF